MVWTDVFQFMVMYGGVLAIIINVRTLLKLSQKNTFCQFVERKNPKRSYIENAIIIHNCRMQMYN